MANPCGRFSRLPAAAIFDSRLRGKPSLLIVLAALGIYADREGFCRPSQVTIARRTGLGLRTVGLAVKSLVDLGYLRSENTTRKRGGKGANAYWLQYPALPADEDYADSSDEESDRHHPSGEGPTPTSGPNPANAIDAQSRLRIEGSESVAVEQRCAVQIAHRDTQKQAPSSTDDAQQLLRINSPLDTTAHPEQPSGHSSNSSSRAHRLNQPNGIQQRRLPLLSVHSRAKAGTGSAAAPDWNRWAKWLQRQGIDEPWPLVLEIISAAEQINKANAERIANRRLHEARARGLSSQGLVAFFTATDSLKAGVA